LQLPAACTRTVEEGTGKYNLKVIATPAKVKFGNGRFTPIKSWYTSSSDLLSWTVRGNACGYTPKGIALVLKINLIRYPKRQLPSSSYNHSTLTTLSEGAITNALQNGKLSLRLE